MRSDPSATCEVKVDADWRRVALRDAYLHHRDTTKRCPACHGAVNITGGFTNGATVLTMAHRKRHAGCSLVGYGFFSGVTSPHPDAVR